MPGQLTIVQVFYTADEIKSFRTLGLEPGVSSATSCIAPPDRMCDAGLKLLGFKSRKELEFEDNIKHSYFIYPDEMVRTCSPAVRPLLLTDEGKGVFR